MKKIYTCKHQKKATSPCSICKEGRGNKFSIWEQAFTCDKCGEVISKGEINTLHKENEEYKEEWVEEHNCQPNSEKVKEKEKQKEEIEKIVSMIEKSNKSYSISCKDCGIVRFSYNFSGRVTEEEKKNAEKILIELWQKHQQDFHSNKVRERERELTPAKVLMTKTNACFVAKI